MPSCKAPTRSEAEEELLNVQAKEYLGFLVTAPVLCERALYEERSEHVQEVNKGIFDNDKRDAQQIKSLATFVSVNTKHRRMLVSLNVEKYG